jgi:hypothetical protein
VLSQRLRELEMRGIVRRRKIGAATYELTAWGQELRAILIQLGRWGARSPDRPQGPLSVDALMVALESTFDAGAAAGLRALYELRLGDERFAIHIDHGSIDIARGAPRRPDAVIDAAPAILRAVVFGDRTLESAPIELSGDKRAARAFFRLFSRPAPCPT